MYKCIKAGRLEIQDKPLSTKGASNHCFYACALYGDAQILKWSSREEQKQKYGWVYVILCKLTAIHNKVRHGKTTTGRHKISTFNLSQVYTVNNLELHFAWYLCCVSVVYTIIFTNSYSAGHAKYA